MKPIAEIPGQLISRELAYQLRLEEEPFIILIPKSILTNKGITAKDLDFELFIENNKISLVSVTNVTPTVRQSTVREITIWITVNR